MRIGVFCGARPGGHSRYVELAGRLGAELAGRDIGLVYGAGGVGVMGAVSRAASRAGGSVTGVITHDLHARERAADASGEIFVVRSMHERKALMYKLSSGFVVLPGGFGTLDEVMEVATWNQLGLHTKPTVLVNQDGFFDPFVNLLDHIVREGFLTPAERTLIQQTSSIPEALDMLCAAAEHTAAPEFAANGAPSGG